MKRFKDFLLENKYPETFNFVFIEKCDECDGTGKEQKERECSYCSGSGIGELGYEDEHGTYHGEEECDRCDGQGEWTEELNCEHCFEGYFEWNLEYIQHKGIKMMHEKYGNSDYPIQYEDGKIGYDNPSAYPLELKNIVKHIFENKDLNKKDIVNSVARFIFEQNYDQFKIPQDMIDLFDQDTKTLMTSYSGIHKFNL